MERSDRNFGGSTHGDCACQIDRPVLNRPHRAAATRRLRTEASRRRPDHAQQGLTLEGPLQKPKLLEALNWRTRLARGIGAGEITLETITKVGYRLVSQHRSIAAARDAPGDTGSPRTELAAQPSSLRTHYRRPTCPPSSAWASTPTSVEFRRGGCRGDRLPYDCAHRRHPLRSRGGCRRRKAPYQAANTTSKGT